MSRRRLIHRIVTRDFGTPVSRDFTRLGEAERWVAKYVADEKLDPNTLRIRTMLEEDAGRW